MLVCTQARLIWKPHGKAKEKTDIIYPTCEKRQSLLCPEIADLSNEEPNTCSKNTFRQPHKSQERNGSCLRDLLQIVG